MQKRKKKHNNIGSLIDISSCKATDESNMGVAKIRTSNSVARRWLKTYHGTMGNCAVNDTFYYLNNFVHWEIFNTVHPREVERSTNSKSEL